MKVFYLNDERKPVDVFIGGLGSHYVCTLQAAEGKVFDVPVPEGSILWVKKWPDYVMLNWADETSFAQSI